MTQAQNSAERTIEHYVEMGRYEKVIELVRKQLADEPLESRWHYLIGVSCYRLDRGNEAEEHANRALQLGFDPVAGHELLGHIHQENEKWIEAEQAYLEVLRLNPNHARVHAAYAGLLKKTGHNRKADQLMQEAMRLDPDDEEVVRHRYLFGIAKSDRAEQVEAMERYLQVADSEVSKQIQLGLGALFRNRTGEAREHFREAYLMDPTNHRLAELLSSLDRVQHVLYAPIRLIQRVGGPGVFWVIGIGSIYGTRALGWYTASIVLTLFYIGLVVYSWLAGPLVKLIMRIRG